MCNLSEFEQALDGLKNVSPANKAEWKKIVKEENTITIWDNQFVFSHPRTGQLNGETVVSYENAIRLVKAIEFCSLEVQTDKQELKPML
jgi:hypothetical protein